MDNSVMRKFNGDTPEGVTIQIDNETAKKLRDILYLNSDPDIKYVYARLRDIFWTSEVESMQTQQTGYHVKTAMSAKAAVVTKPKTKGGIKVQCQECNLKFHTKSMLPECPKCGSSDIDIQY